MRSRSNSLASAVSVAVRLLCAARHISRSARHGRPHRPRSPPATARRSSRTAIIRRTGRATPNGPPPIRKSPPSTRTAWCGPSAMARPASPRRAKGRTATVTVRVKDAHAPFTWSFRNDVIPVMTKMGCNSGRLPRRAGGQERIQADPARLRSRRRLRHAHARSPSGRRVIAGRSRRSLMLLKPTFAIPHGGGKRFANDSLEYRVIEEWIAAGAPPPADNDAAVTRPRSFSRRRRARARRRAAACGARQVLRRPRPRRHALGEVQLQQRRRGHRGRLRAT